MTLLHTPHTLTSHTPHTHHALTTHSPHIHHTLTTHSPHTTVHTQTQSSEKSAAVSELAKAGEFNGPNPELNYAPLPKVDPKWRED